MRESPIYHSVTALPTYILNKENYLEPVNTTHTDINIYLTCLHIHVFRFIYCLNTTSWMLILKVVTVHFEYIMF